MLAILFSLTIVPNWASEILWVVPIAAFTWVIASPNLFWVNIESVENLKVSANSLLSLVASL